MDDKQWSDDEIIDAMQKIAYSSPPQDTYVPIGAAIEIATKIRNDLIAYNAGLHFMILEMGKDNQALRQETERLQATLDGDPHQIATPDQRRAWRLSAVRYADKLEKELAELRQELATADERNYKLTDDKEFWRKVAVEKERQLQEARSWQPLPDGDILTVPFGNSSLRLTRTTVARVNLPVGVAICRLQATQPAAQGQGVPSMVQASIAKLLHSWWNRYGPNATYITVQDWLNTLPPSGGDSESGGEDE